MLDAFCTRLQDPYPVPEGDVKPPSKEQAARIFDYHVEAAFPSNDIPRAAVNFAIFLNCWRSVLDRHNSKSVYGQYYSASKRQNPLHFLPKETSPDSHNTRRSLGGNTAQLDLRTQYARRRSI